MLDSWERTIFSKYDIVASFDYMSDIEHCSNCLSFTVLILASDIM